MHRLFNMQLFFPPALAVVRDVVCMICICERCDVCVCVCQICKLYIYVVCVANTKLKLIQVMMQTCSHVCRFFVNFYLLNLADSQKDELFSHACRLDEVFSYYYWKQPLTPQPPFFQIFSRELKFETSLP